MNSDECFLIQNLAEDEIWRYLEGNVAKETANSVRKHLMGCRACLEFYARITQQLSEADPARYNLAQKENLSIRKAELLRFCRAKGVEIDLSKVRQPEDYVKYAIAATLEDYGPGFLDLWDRMNPEQREKMLIGALRILAQDEQGG